MEGLIEELKKLNIKIEENVLLSNYTSYKVGGKARLIVYPSNEKALVETVKLINNANIKFKLLGNGTNLLFSSKDYNNVLIKLSSFNKIEVKGNKIYAEAGAPLPRLAVLAKNASLTGLEFAAGIPGTLGGAIFQNAGAYKSDMGYVIQSVKVLTPDYRIINFTNKECEFHYRTSFFTTHPGYICLSAIISLKYGSKNAIESVMKDRLDRRLASQPLSYPSAGSVFRNPDNADPAGKLIEDLGLKGLKIGGAEVSTKHANFIINANNAKAEDIHKLILFVKDKVKKEYGIDLKIEQEFVNWEN